MSLDESLAGGISRRGFLGAAGAVALDSFLPNAQASTPDLDMMLRLAALSALQDRPERMPKPSAAALKKAETEVTDTFKDGYKTRDADFAVSLLDDASQMEGAIRYVMLRDSAEIAAENFDLTTSYNAIEKIAETYKFDLDDIFSVVFKDATRARPKIDGREKASQLADFGYNFAQLAMKWDSYDAAGSAAKNVQRYARAARNADLYKLAGELAKEARTLEREYNELQKSEFALSAIDPLKEPDAWDKHSSVVGMWYAFRKGNWDIGITHLQTAKDEDIQAAARVDKMASNLANPTASNLFQAGEKWYELAKERREDHEKNGCFARAKHWYERAETLADGLLKAKIGRRLEELANIGAASGGYVDLLKMIEPSKDTVAGKWEFKDGKLVSDQAAFARIQIPYQPPEEYDIKLVFSRQDGQGDVNVVLYKSDKQFMWLMGADRNTVSGFEFVKGKDHKDNPTTTKLGLKNGRDHVALIKVRNEGLTAYLDNRQVTQYKTDYSDMSMNGLWNLRNKNVLGLGTWQSPTMYKSVQLKEITGKGEKQRQ